MVKSVSFLGRQKWPNDYATPFLLEYATSVFQEEVKNGRRVFIVHGELESARALQTELRLALKEKKVKVVIPELNEEVELL